MSIDHSLDDYCYLLNGWITVLRLLKRVKCPQAAAEVVKLVDEIQDLGSTIFSHEDHVFDTPLWRRRNATIPLIPDAMAMVDDEIPAEVITADIKSYYDLRAAFEIASRRHYNVLGERAPYLVGIQ